MNVLVTGADGFIGSHLTESLLAKGHNVKVLSQCNCTIWILTPIRYSKGIGNYLRLVHQIG